MTTNDFQAVLVVLERILQFRVVTGQITLHIHQGQVKAVDAMVSKRLNDRESGIDVVEKPGLH